MHMRNLPYLIILLAFACSACTSPSRTTYSVQSPDGRINVQLHSDNKAGLAYTAAFNENLVLDTSWLGMSFKGQDFLIESYDLTEVEEFSGEDSYSLPWGEQEIVENKFNELRLSFLNTSASIKSFQIHFKVYDDGFAFRYVFPEIPGPLTLEDELTQFNLTSDPMCWWIPGDWDIYEHLYTTCRFSEIDALSKQNHSSLAQTYIPENAVNTPVTMKTDNGIYLSFHEANLTNYPGMTLKIQKEELSMTSELVGSERLMAKAFFEEGFQTPWRMVLIADRAGDLVESKMILNLNEPSKLEDVSWFTPTKYAGIWWEMHIGKSSWDMASGKHGATTAHAKEMIDFASENNIPALLVEGWNTGWERWFGIPDREGVFDFVTPYPDYNLEEVVAYGKEKGVKIIMHHETSAAPGPTSSNWIRHSSL